MATGLVEDSIKNNNAMKHFIMIFCAFGFFVHQNVAQDLTIHQLDEAIAHAFKHNADLKDYQNNIEKSKLELKTLGGVEFSSSSHKIELREGLESQRKKGKSVKLDSEKPEKGLNIVTASC